MTEILNLFAISVVLIAALTSIVVWSRRRLGMKIWALVVAALLIPTGYASMAALLSQPKPIAMEWARRAVPEAVVLGSDIREGEAIYIWLKIKGLDEPRAYRLPWSLSTARELSEATREARELGTRLRMQQPFGESTRTRAPVFYAEPMPSLPPKPVADRQPLIYSRPEHEVWP